jgi:hypothetical protein
VRAQFFEMDPQILQQMTPLLDAARAVGIARLAAA